MNTVCIPFAPGAIRRDEVQESSRPGREGELCACNDHNYFNNKNEFGNNENKQQLKWLKMHILLKDGGVVLVDLLSVTAGMSRWCGGPGRWPPYALLTRRLCSKIEKTDRQIMQKTW